MFEKKVLEISKQFSGTKKEFFILTHKKHKREIYFRNEREAIDFIKVKFNSKKKRIVYLSLKLGLLKPFLRKIKLPSEIGHVIFVGGQLKCFNLDKNEVHSFRLTMDHNDFIKSKKTQKKIAKVGFAPEIYEMNEKKDYTKEELLKVYTGGDDISVFRDLLSFYDTQGIKEMSLDKYLTFLKRSLLKAKIKDTEINKALNHISKKYPKSLKLKVTNVHGDFTKEQILIKNDKYVFTDWCGYEGLIVRDVTKFFRDCEDLLKSPKFIKILKLFPIDMQKNIKLYIALNEIFSMIRRKEVTNISMRRIKNVLN